MTNKPKAKMDTAAIKKLYLAHPLVDMKAVIALTMRYSGATYQEIGEALNTTRQQATNIFEAANSLLKGGDKHD